MEWFFGLEIKQKWDQITACHLISYVTMGKSHNHA